ncbi:hypothetical protein RSAG8_01943, partial [Rhizoctonia solani AG-8 WAC10335]
MWLDRSQARPSCSSFLCLSWCMRYQRKAALYFMEVRDECKSFLFSKRLGLHKCWITSGVVQQLVEWR